MPAPAYMVNMIFILALVYMFNVVFILAQDYMVNVIFFAAPAYIIIIIITIKSLLSEGTGIYNNVHNQ